MERIRYGGIIAGGEEIAAVTEVLKGQEWASGAKVAEFEEKAAGWQGCRRALFVNSGSSALLLAMSVLPEHSRIAMPALQFPTLYSAAVRIGHIPVLVDIDDTLNMDPARLDEVTGSVDAVAFVHMAGNPANIREVRDICARHGLLLIEDVCEALGASDDGIRAGKVGLVSAVSTHGAHHICTGEGGLAFTDDEAAYQKMRRIRDWGRAYGTFEIPGYYEHYIFSELGFNLHASDIQAALGIVQLDRAGGFIERRRENWDHLRHEIREMPIELPRTGTDPSWFAFPMLVPERRAEFISHLENSDIECRTIVAGNMPRQPICNDNPERFPFADKWFHRGLWISVHPRITPEQIAYAGEKVREFWA